jgi:hypothetical protein
MVEAVPLIPFVAVRLPSRFAIVALNASASEELTLTPLFTSIWGAV